ncbi:MAG: hypothetical protein U0936_26390 [Planctomycetaceae bacterium]
MVASPDNPFSSNPYMAPEMQEPVDWDRTTTVPGSVWKWLVVVLVIEAVMTIVMITFHSSSPRVGGLNIYAIANLFLSGILAITFAWFLGRRSSGLRVLLIAQLANLLIWLTFGTMVHLRFGIRLTGEGSLFLTSAVAGAILSLVASLVSSGAFRSRVIHS